MGHMCDECGTTFETLSALRLHDCPAAEPAGDGQADHDREQEVDIDADLERIRELEQAAQRRAEQRSSTALTDALAQAQAGEPAAVHQLLAYYERHLADEWDREDDDCYWPISRRLSTHQRGMRLLAGGDKPLEMLALGIFLPNISGIMSGIVGTTSPD